MFDRKLLFFDIDGTLVDFNDELPASCVEALWKAHEAGHYMFICTGRGGAQVDKRLKALPFDGIVSATGADVRFHDEVLLAKMMTEPMRERFMEVMEEADAYYAFQGYENVSMTKRSLDRMTARFREIGASEERIQTIFGGINVLEDMREAKGAEKAIYYDARKPVPYVREKLKDILTIEPVSFDRPEDFNGEVTQIGINKAYGIRLLMERLGVERKDVYAFGDGPNDLDMLKFAGTGVAMGNAWDIVKETADMVTKNVNEDGIYYGLEELGVI
ncbi:MAG: Cof-type HAD-IIB family hydrolase [Lachnospiraceae bacterium]|nr:Cof-type HAD-IIB family hydrolase [Lachnospiraceae bacterium]